MYQPLSLSPLFDGSFISYKSSLNDDDNDVSYASKTNDFFFSLFVCLYVTSIHRDFFLLRTDIGLGLSLTFRVSMCVTCTKVGSWLVCVSLILATLLFFLSLSLSISLQLSLSSSAYDERTTTSCPPASSSFVAQSFVCHRV